jgi:hypothetical protein
MQVWNSVTSACLSVTCGAVRARNQVEKRCFAKGGSTRAAAMPVTFSSSLRAVVPGFWVILFASPP